MADLELVKEELGRVYGLYGAQHRSFRRSLYGLIVVGLALFAVIVVPFLTFRDQLADLRLREEQLAVAKQAAVEQRAALQVDLESLSSLDQDLRRFAQKHRSLGYYKHLAEAARVHGEKLDELRGYYLNHSNPELVAWAKGRRDTPPEKAIATDRLLSSASYGRCAWKEKVPHVACQVCEAFEKEDARISHGLTRMSVAERLQIEGLTPLVTRACNWLVDGKPHWRTGRPFDYRNPNRIRGHFSQDLRAYEQGLREVAQRVRAEVPLIATAIGRLERTQSDTSEQLSVLERQLNRIASFDRLGTPIGDLPVGLGQIVLLFPVVLALAYVILASSYARLASLRAALTRLSRKRDADRDVMDSAHIAVIAPLWLDRSDALGSRIVKIMILCLPLALILANLALIHETRALAEQLPEDSALSPQVYLGLYAVSLLLALGGLIHILRAARSHA